MRTIIADPLSLTEIAVHEFGSGEPVMAITAGIHGDEHTGILAAHLLMDTLRRKRNLRGRVKIIPVCNPAAYRHRSRCSPFDGLDMNRIFPGDPCGSATQLTAHAIWSELSDVRMLVDLHCCGIYGSNYVVTLHDEYDHQREMAEALGIPYAVRSGGARGQLFLEACHAGKQAVLIELKGGQPSGFIDLESARMCHDAVIRLMIHAGLLDGAASRGEITYFDRLIPVHAKRHGLFLPEVEAGAILREGQVFATLDGEPLSSPCTGLISSVMPPRYCFAGERLARIAPFAAGNGS